MKKEYPHLYRYINNMSILVINIPCSNIQLSVSSSRFTKEHRILRGLAILGLDDAILSPYGPIGLGLLGMLNNGVGSDMIQVS